MVRPSDSMRLDSSDALPRPFGRLILLRRLAQGGMGEVFLAASGGIDGAERPCVLKRIRQEHASDRSFVARFLDEARVQAQLQHPGVAQIFEAAKDDDGQPYVVVEYVEGRSLAEIRNRLAQLGSRLEWHEAVAIIASVAEALAHVHERVDSKGRPLSIAHRDLSPQNIMVGYAGDAKLIDFGTARGENRRCHTVSGVVYAKPGYVAPEVANGIPGDGRADIYALGVMLWELCAGKRFLQGDATDHMTAVAANRRPLLPVAAEIGAPLRLDEILASITHYSLQERTSSARAVLRELTQLLTQSPAMASGERGVRPRIAHALHALYPSEPNRSRAEFQRLLADAKQKLAQALTPSAEAPAAPLVPDGTLIPGTRYRSLRELGQGSCGAVFEVVHVDLSRRLAMKLMSAELRGNERARELFRREARVMSRVTHPNVVRFHDFGETSAGDLYVVMELIEGLSLEQWHSQHAELAVEDVLRLTRQIALGLGAVHEAGAVHRDLKPSNILLTQDGTAKLIDFGIAWTPGDDAEELDEKSGNSPKLLVYGTPEYMAPEQLEGRVVDARADIYALGTIFYELLTDTLPYSSSELDPLLSAKRRGPPELPSERAPVRQFPRAMDRFIERTLAPDPAARLQDVQALLKELDSLARHDSDRARGRRSTARALLASFLGVVLAAGGYAWWSDLAGTRDRLSTPISAMASEMRSLLHGVSPLAPREAAAPVLAPLALASAASSSGVKLAELPQEVTSAAASVASAAATVATAAMDQAPRQVEDAASQATSPEEVARLRALAKKAISHREWQRARQAAGDWVAAAPDSAEANAVLHRLDALIAAPGMPSKRASRTTHHGHH